MCAGCEAARILTQAEEEAAAEEAAAKEAAEKAAKEAAEAAEAADVASAPVKRVRKLASSGASPREVLAELNTIDAEGGQIGRTRILYEVSWPHSLSARGQNF